MWVQVPPDSLALFDKPVLESRAHDVAVACYLAMVDVWVRLPLGALATVPHDGGIQTLAQQTEHQTIILEVTGAIPVSYSPLP